MIKHFLKIKNFQELNMRKFLISSNLVHHYSKLMLLNKRKKTTIKLFIRWIEIPNFLVQYEFNKENQTKK